MVRRMCRCSVDGGKPAVDCKITSDLLILQPMKSISTLLSFAVVLLCSIIPVACGRDSRHVSPTGWATIGEPFDSLSRKLELSLIVDTDLDTLSALAGRFADAASRPGVAAEAVRRNHFWQARVASRRDDRNRSEREMQLATGGKDDAEKEYINRRVGWLREDMGEYSRLEWYRHLVEEVEYYSRRSDYVMLYARYVDLTNLMRDVGYRTRALTYLALADSCASKIGGYIHFPGPVINHACVLYDLGKKEEAGRIFRQLEADSAAMADEDIYALVNYNMFVLHNDTAALHRAYLNLHDTPERLNLFPVVAAQMAKVAAGKGDLTGARTYASEAESVAGDIRQSYHLLLVLEAIAEINYRGSDKDMAVKAWREYALAADSIRRALADNEVVSQEAMAQIQQVESEMAERAECRRRNLWLGGVVATLLVVSLTVFMVRRVRRANQRRREAEKRNDEANRRNVAMQVASDRKEQALSEAMRQVMTLEEKGVMHSGDSRNLMRMLKEAETGGGSGAFLELFAEVSPGFIDRLRELCPTISDAAIRLACYTVMGLDTKEIATTMNVRPESVRQARWRLRSQLGMNGTEDLSASLRKLMV